MVSMKEPSRGEEGAYTCTFEELHAGITVEWWKWLFPDFSVTTNWILQVTGKHAVLP